MKDKKAAKIIIKRAKEHPDWYTEQDVKFAKMVKKRIKREKQAKKSLEILGSNFPREIGQTHRRVTQLIAVVNSPTSYTSKSSHKNGGRR